MLVSLDIGENNSFKKSIHGEKKSNGSHIDGIFITDDVISKRFGVVLNELMSNISYY